MATSDRIADQILDVVQDAVTSQDFSNLQSKIEDSFNAAACGIGRGVAQAQDAYKQAQQARAAQAQDAYKQAQQARAAQAQDAYKQAQQARAAQAQDAYKQAQQARAAQAQDAYKQAQQARAAQAQDAYKQAQQAKAVQTQRREEEKQLLKQRQKTADAWIRQAKADRQRLQQREQQLLTVYAKPNRLRDEGLVMTVCGAFVLAPTFFVFIAALMSGTWTVPVVVGAVLAVGIALLVKGVKVLSLSSRFKVYRDYIGMRDYCTVEELSRTTGEDSKRVLANIKRMMKKNLFLEAAFDSQETTLIMNRRTYAQYEQAQDQYRARLRQQSLADSVSPQSSPDTSMSEDATALLARGEAYIAKIRLSNEAIEGEEISAKIDQIEEVVGHILKRAQAHPEIVGDLGQLMDYYLPTTVKLLDAYRDLDSQPIQGENILKSKQEIEGALDALAVAFEKLLDQVFRDVAWDVSSDVSVLHTVLAQEGLAEDPFAPSPTHPPTHHTS